MRVFNTKSNEHVYDYSQWKIKKLKFENGVKETYTTHYSTYDKISMFDLNAV